MAGVYYDDGVSGYKFNPDQRPGSSAMIKFCAAHPRPKESPGLVVVWSLSRFGRFVDGPEEAIYHIYALRRCGWILRSVTQPELEYEAGNDKARLLRTIQAALAAETDVAHSEVKSTNVVSGKDDAVRLGVWPGSGPPYGYDRWAANVSGSGAPLREEDYLEILRPGKFNGYSGARTVLRPNETQAIHVRQIYEWYVDGIDGSRPSLNEIARRMIEAKVSTEAARGSGLWHPSVVAKILSNPVYIAVQRDQTGKEHPARWEPLVSRELWDRAQQRLGENKRAGRSLNTQYVLSGLLKCMRCGGALFGELDSERGKAYYRAKSIPGRSSCAGCRHRIRVEDLEPLVIDAVGGLADRPEVIQAIEEERQILRQGNSARSAEIQEVMAAMHAVQLQINGLAMGLRLGGAVTATLERDAEQLNREMERLQRRERQLRQHRAGHVQEFRDSANKFASLFRAAGAAEKKALLRCFVERIEIDGETGNVRVAVRRPAAA